MAAEGSRSLFRLNAVDRRGRKIEPAVLEAAEGIYPRALEHGLKLLGDPAVVTTALEEVAATVSRVIRTKDPPGDPAQVRDLRAYMFRAFLRHVNHLKRKELAVVSLSEAGQISEQRWADPLRELENKMLLDECLAQCDSPFLILPLRSPGLCDYSARPRATVPRDTSSETTLDTYTRAG
jgi:hypothetical protein